MNEIVECRSDTTYAEKPVALVWEGARLEVAAILSRWRSPDAVHFRVRASNQQDFELTYDEAADRWRIQSI